MKSAESSSGYSLWKKHISTPLKHGVSCIASLSRGAQVLLRAAKPSEAPSKSGYASIDDEASETFVAGAVLDCAELVQRLAEPVDLNHANSAARWESVNVTVRGEDGKTYLTPLDSLRPLQRIKADRIMGSVNERVLVSWGASKGSEYSLARLTGIQYDDDEADKRIKKIEFLIPSVQSSPIELAPSQFLMCEVSTDAMYLPPFFNSLGELMRSNEDALRDFPTYHEYAKASLNMCMSKSRSSIKLGPKDASEALSVAFDALLSYVPISLAVQRASQAKLSDPSLEGVPTPLIEESAQMIEGVLVALVEKCVAKRFYAMSADLLSRSWIAAVKGALLLREQLSGIIRILESLFLPSESSSSNVRRVKAISDFKVAVDALRVAKESLGDALHGCCDRAIDICLLPLVESCFEEVGRNDWMSTSSFRRGQRLSHGATSSAMVCRGAIHELVLVCIDTHPDTGAACSSSARLVAELGVRAIATLLDSANKTYSAVSVGRVRYAQWHADVSFVLAASSHTLLFVMASVCSKSAPHTWATLVSPDEIEAMLSSMIAVLCLLFTRTDPSHESIVQTYKAISSPSTPEAGYPADAEAWHTLTLQLVHQILQQEKISLDSMTLGDLPTERTEAGQCFVAYNSLADFIFLGGMNDSSEGQLAALLASQGDDSKKSPYEKFAGTVIGNPGMVFSVLGVMDGLDVSDVKGSKRDALKRWFVKHVRLRYEMSDASYPPLTPDEDAAHQSLTAFFHEL